MTRPTASHKVLDSEVTRWSAMSCAELASALRDVQAYVVQFDSRDYQVEVELLENTDGYLHVLVSVDDGTFLGAISPRSHSFICRK
jgi:hypothetical protein